MADIIEPNLTGTTGHYGFHGSSRTARILVLVAAFAGCVWTVHYWLANFGYIYSDSACYINAADNLVKHGELFDFANRFTGDQRAVPEPYTEWPPGTPLFLAPFILLFHDPMLAALVAQIVLIILAFAALVAFASALDLNPVLTLALLAVFALLSPFQLSASQYASETPFFITSLMAGYYAVKIVREGPSKKYWVMGLLFVFLASSVRFSGVANIGWYIPLLGPTLGLRKNGHDDRVTLVVRRIMLIAGSAILLVSVWFEHYGLFVPDSFYLLRFILLIAGFLSFLLGLGLFPALERMPGAIAKQGNEGRSPRVNLLRLSVAAAAIAPLVVWFLRNEILHGEITKSHRLLETFNTQGILETPRMLCYYMLQNRFVPQEVSIFAFALLALVPLVIGEGRTRTVGAVLVCATFFQVVTMWASSIFANYAFLDQRLLAPAVLLGVITVIYGINVLYRTSAKSKLRFVILLVPFFFLATSRLADFRLSDLLSWKVYYPNEMYLWREIHEMKWTLQSPMVYTGADYRHQLFTDIPQKLLHNPDMLTDPVRLENILSEPGRPFFVFSENGMNNSVIRTTIDRYHLDIRSIVYPEQGYVLYYKPPTRDK